MSEIGTKALADYQYAYSNNERGAETISGKKGDQYSVTKHWEKMLIDTSYRDLSGRMIRAFPTYMLWLIDEGGMFFGTKVFNNFYGLQSLIDFSIVQSEDILGDTLIFRVSNMYSKLNRPETSRIFEIGTQSDPSQINMAEGLSKIVDTLLNRSRNFKAHFDNKYIVDIENIRLKPGVRVHLRGGYGSNPNALQTLFNGLITNVEMGEIVTVTCQSDAIELSPIINSANKKGNSGKIDGGINTGMFMSEPRDLMVKLLSMGTSRFREAIGHATRGTVFSENKFGIRHFGTILYEPLSDLELEKNRAIKQAFKNAIDVVSDESFDMSQLLKAAWNNTVGSYNGVDAAVIGGSIAAGGVAGGLPGAFLAGVAGGALRLPVAGHMRTLMANLSTQRDYEVFKRNIYPGNGLGVSQFLGGDLDVGWSTAASVDQGAYDELSMSRKAYLQRLGDASWDRAIQNNNALIDVNIAGKGIQNTSNAIGTSQLLSGAAAVAGVGLIATGFPVFGFFGQSMIGSGLLGAINGRTTAGIFETLGLVSRSDDDMRGFDEVSFRAQTYMRSVWDMFQLCARLLPNYICAIRPFEDRSTIFYGKPHWLYTSGVMPISTGFVGEQAALRMGKKYNGPKTIDRDSDLVELLDIINRESNPMADASAFQKNFEGSSPLDLAEEFIQSAYDGSNEFLPVSYIKDKYKKKLINFEDPRRMIFYDKTQKKVVARLPVNKGVVSVGFHLPFGQPTSTERSITDIAGTHKQISKLPFRYQFPYFTDRKTTSFDGFHGGYIFNFNARALLGYYSDGDVYHNILSNKAANATSVADGTVLFARRQ